MKSIFLFFRQLLFYALLMEGLIVVVWYVYTTHNADDLEMAIKSYSGEVYKRPEGRLNSSLLHFFFAS